MSRFQFLSGLVVILLICMSVQLPAGQDQAAKPSTQAPRPPEPAIVQEIQEVTAVETSAPLTAAEWLGRIHPALVHFPIAWLVLLLLVEIIALTTGRADWSNAGLWLLIAVLIAALPAVATGFLRASSLGTEPEVLALMVPHRNLNIAAGLVCLLALGLRLAWRDDMTRTRRRVHLFLIAGAAALMLLAGHLGGKMVFGRNYLPF